MFDEPRLGHTKLFWVNEDETPRLSKGLEHKCCQPRRSKDRNRQGQQIKAGDGAKKEPRGKIKIIQYVQPNHAKIHNDQKFDRIHIFKRVSFLRSHTFQICQKKQGSVWRRMQIVGQFCQKFREKEMAGIDRYKELKTGMEVKMGEDGCGMI